MQDTWNVLGAQIIEYTRVFGLKGIWSIAPTQNIHRWHLTVKLKLIFAFEFQLLWLRYLCSLVKICAHFLWILQRILFLFILFFYFCSNIFFITLFEYLFCLLIVGIAHDSLHFFHSIDRNVRFITEGFYRRRLARHGMLRVSLRELAVNWSQF